jgi:hypothetical protein
MKDKQELRPVYYLQRDGMNAERKKGWLHGTVKHQKFLSIHPDEEVFAIVETEDGRVIETLFSTIVFADR